MTATASHAGPALEYLDPASLLTDANIRLDLRLDQDFIASIKDQGVLVPVVAVRTADGSVRVWYGHRRALAAVEAGVTVPVLIVADEKTGDAATVDRIVGQYAENTQRAALTTSEHARVVAQLLDLGLTAGQIQRRTKMAKPDITAAQAVSKSPTAADAMAAYQALTLSQAGTLAEFDDDPDAIQTLITAASQGEVRFEHTARQLRDNRDLRRAGARARAELEAAGVTVADALDWSNALEYLRDVQGEQLTEEGHRDCPGHAAYLLHDWRYDQPRSETAADDGESDDDESECQPVFRTVWLCTDPRAYGHQGRFATSSRQRVQDLADSADLAAAAEAARDERRRVIANNKAWRCAETVRREWLTGLLARKNPPKGALRYAMREIARHTGRSAHPSAAATRWPPACSAWPTAPPSPTRWPPPPRPAPR